MRFNWLALPTVLLAFCVPIFIDDIVRKSPLHGKGFNLFELLVAGIVMVIIPAVPALGSERVVLLTGEHLRFGTEAVGRKLSSRTYSTSSLYDLRTNPVVSDWTGKDIQNRSAIEIGYEQGYRALVSGVTDAEATAIIAKMLGVFAFPRCLSIQIV